MDSSLEIYMTKFAWTGIKLEDENCGSFQYFWWPINGSLKIHTGTSNIDSCLAKSSKICTGYWQCF